VVYASRSYRTHVFLGRKRYVNEATSNVRHLPYWVGSHMSLERLRSSRHCSILHSKPDEKREEKENKNYDCFFLHDHTRILVLCLCNLYKGQRDGVNVERSTLPYGVVFFVDFSACSSASRRAVVICGRVSRKVSL
jgi:hypothetical protein